MSCTCQLDLFNKHYNPSEALCNLDKRTVWSFPTFYHKYQPFDYIVCDYCCSFTIYTIGQGMLLKTQIHDNEPISVPFELSDCVCGNQSQDVSSYGYDMINEDTLPKIEERLCERLPTYCRVCKYNDIFITSTVDGLLSVYKSKYVDDWADRYHSRLVKQ